MKKIFYTAVAAAAVLAGSVAVAAPAMASNGPVTVTANTHLNNHPDTTSVSGPATIDSGNGPVWAYDNATEKFTAIQQINGSWVVNVDYVGSFHGFADPSDMPRARRSPATARSRGPSPSPSLRASRRMRPTCRASPLRTLTSPATSRRCSVGTCPPARSVVATPTCSASRTGTTFSTSPPMGRTAPRATCAVTELGGSQPVRARARAAQRHGLWHAHSAADEPPRPIGVSEALPLAFGQKRLPQLPSIRPAMRPAGRR